MNTPTLQFYFQGIATIIYCFHVMVKNLCTLIDSSIIVSTLGNRCFSLKTEVCLNILF